MKKIVLAALCGAAALSMLFVYKKTYAALITAGQSVTVINQTKDTQQVSIALGMNNAPKPVYKNFTIAPGQQTTVHTSGSIDAGGLPISVKTMKVGGNPSEELTIQELILDEDLLNRAIKIAILANGGINAELDTGRDIISAAGSSGQPSSTLGGF